MDQVCKIGKLTSGLAVVLVGAIEAIARSPFLALPISSETLIRAHLVRYRAEVLFKAAVDRNGCGKLMSSIKGVGNSWQPNGRLGCVSSQSRNWQSQGQCVPASQGFEN